jgi:NAD(P)H-dependent flavin oxidoreductase YrpB (nitropropane dioxygenase family)
MLHTRLCDLLGIEFPILSAPMGPDVSGPELVAAVSNAGGLGIMQAQWHPAPLLRQAIRRVRQLTDKPFGVNLLLHFPCDEGVTVCVEERVPVVSFFRFPALTCGTGPALRQTGSLVVFSFQQLPLVLAST